MTAVRRAAAAPLLLSACLAGCARTGEPPRAPSTAPVPTEPASTATAPEASDADAPAEGPIAPPPAKSFATRTIGGAGPDARGTLRLHPGGGRIDLETRGAALADVCRLLADVGRVDLLVDEPAARLPVTVRLRDVGWDRALEAIVASKGLVLENKGRILIVHDAGRER